MGEARERLYGLGELVPQRTMREALEDDDELEEHANRRGGVRGGRDEETTMADGDMQNDDDMKSLARTLRCVVNQDGSASEKLGRKLLDPDGKRSDDEVVASAKRLLKAMGFPLADDGDEGGDEETEQQAAIRERMGFRDGAARVHWERSSRVYPVIDAAEARRMLERLAARRRAPMARGRR